jgi:hypothetical protein
MAGIKRHVVVVEYAEGFGIDGRHDGTLTLPVLAKRIVFVLRPVREWKGGPAAESIERSFFGNLVRAALGHRSVTFVGVEDVPSAVLGFPGAGPVASKNTSVHVPFEDAVPALYHAAKRISKKTPGSTLRSCKFLTRDQYRAKVGREVYQTETERWWVTGEEPPPFKAEVDPYVAHPSLYPVWPSSS